MVLSLRFNFIWLACKLAEHWFVDNGIRVTLFCYMVACHDGNLMKRCRTAYSLVLTCLVWQSKLSEAMVWSDKDTVKYG